MDLSRFDGSPKVTWALAISLLIPLSAIIGCGEVSESTQRNSNRQIKETDQLQAPQERRKVVGTHLGSKSAEVSVILDRTRFLLGEPVPWRCRITNTSNSDLSIFTGGGAPDWSPIVIHISDAEGKELRGGELAGSSGPGHFRLGPQVLSAGESLDLTFEPRPNNPICGGYRRANKLPTAPGKYFLKAEYVPPDGQPKGFLGDRVESEPVAFTVD